MEERIKYCSPEVEQGTLVEAAPETYSAGPGLSESETLGLGPRSPDRTSLLGDSDEDWSLDISAGKDFPVVQTHC